MHLKSGVSFEGMHRPEVTEKETALAMLQSIKDMSGLFVDNAKAAYKAPHICENRKPVRFGLLPTFTGLSAPITSFRARDSNGVLHRHYLGECKCGRRSLVVETIREG